MKTVKVLRAVLVVVLCFATEVADEDSIFGKLQNLGPVVNSSYIEVYPSLSSDGLMLYFGDIYSGPHRPGAFSDPLVGDPRFRQRVRLARTYRL